MVRDGVRFHPQGPTPCLEIVLRRGNGFFDRFRPLFSKRKYELDTFGSFVLEKTDGRNRVLDVVNAFEKRFSLSRRESELGVVAFYRMLLQRRLISLVSGENT